MNTFCTTYCNRAHDVKTGRPIDHECHVLPPAAIKAEMDGDTAKASEILNAARPMRVVIGRPRRRRLPWATVPAEMLAHGFTADLIAAVTAAAKDHGQPITYHRKNGEVYIAVLLPDADERARIDAQTPCADETLLEGGSL